MAKKAPPVSVLTTVYNGEKFLGETIQSVLGQTFQDFEYIIINDGSTDSSDSIIRSFRKKDKRIRYFCQKNRGIAWSKNRGVKIARGKYIAFLDQDDIAYPNRLAVQLEYLSRHRGTAVIGSFYDLIDDKGRKFNTVTLPTKHEAIYKDNLLEGINVICPCTIMADVKEIRSVGNFDQALEPADDYDLWLKLGRQHKIRILDQVLGAYRYHSKNTTDVQAGLIEYKRWEACVKERRFQKLENVPRGFVDFSPKPVPNIRRLSQFALKGRHWKLSLEYGMKQLLSTPWSLSTWAFCFLAGLGLLGVPSGAIGKFYKFCKWIIKKNQNS